MQWTNVDVYPMTMPRNKEGRIYWTRTERCEWCGADSMFFVSRTSLLSDRRYSSAACQIHADEWRKLVVIHPESN